MAELKEWAVELVVTSVHQYIIPARTQEEAAEVAEESLDDGDEGKLLSRYVETAEVVNVDGLSSTEDEDFFEEETLEP